MIRVRSLFSGMGAFEKALTRSGIGHTVVDYCEIDRNASLAYSLIHGIPESKNLGDVTKVNGFDLEYTDLLVGGSPCTNFSLLSKCQPDDGLQGLRGKESGLFFSYLDILWKTLPAYFIFENVDSVEHMGDEWNMMVDLLGMYHNVVSFVLDAKDFDIPQSRKRMFVVGIRHDIRRYIKVPVGHTTSKIVRDILESNVDPKYQLSDRAMEYMDRRTSNGRTHWDYCYHSYADGISKCLIKSIYKGVPHGIVMIHGVPRRYTPLECFRLMGFDDADYYKVVGKISDTQLYKMCGNSIVVNVLEAIFTNLFGGTI